MCVYELYEKQVSLNLIIAPVKICIGAPRSDVFFLIQRSALRNYVLNQLLVTFSLGLRAPTPFFVSAPCSADPPERAPPGIHERNEMAFFFQEIQKHNFHQS